MLATAEGRDHREDAVHERVGAEEQDERLQRDARLEEGQQPEDDDARVGRQQVGVHVDRDVAAAVERDPGRLELLPHAAADTEHVSRVEGAKQAVDQIMGGPTDKLGRDLELTDPLDRSITPDTLTFSGGVSEYIFETETRDFGDITYECDGDDCMAKLDVVTEDWEVAEHMFRALNAASVGR